MRRSPSGPVGREYGEPLPSVADVPKVPKSFALVRVHPLRRHYPVPCHGVPFIPPGRGRKHRIFRPLGPALLCDQPGHTLVQRSPGADVVLHRVLREGHSPPLLPDEVWGIPGGLRRVPGWCILLDHELALSPGAVSFQLWRRL